MKTQKSQQSCAWPRRREEYLRVSGRHDDLIKEGYVEVPADGKWRLIPGGRPKFQPKENRPIGLFLVKRPPF
jgi:hypothetical protein